MSVQTLREVSHIESDLSDARETLRILKLENSTIPDAIKKAEQSLDLITFDELRKRESHLPMLIRANDRHVTQLQVELLETQRPAFEFEVEIAQVEADEAIAAMPAAQQALRDAQTRMGNAVGRLRMALMRLNGIGQEISDLQRNLQG